MSRGQGRVWLPKKNSKTWWLDYGVSGERRRESAHTTNKREALRILRQRMQDREAGRLIGSPDRIRFAQLRELAERQYRLDGRRSLGRLQDALDHLERFFGKEARALEITKPRIDEYTEQRLTAGASRATVNYELASLRRAFRLAVENGQLAMAPVFKLPKVHNERQGFFEEDDLAALLVELPVYLRAPIRFARMTGWRVRSEILPLIRLPQAATKGGEPRLFPFGQAPELKALLKERWAARDGLFVFHRGGRCIRDFRTAWKRACKRAGLEGRIPHDLRRTAARDYRRAGVSEREIMELCGWRTRSTFERYNIIDEADRAHAVARRFSNLNGKPTANLPAPETPAEHVS